ncbi:MAG: hypothetical protein WC644_01130 [Ignavibacteria bacterium]
MKYDIIREFPIAQLNDILGGIRSNSEYSFVFNRLPFNGKGVCEDILRILNRDIASVNESALKFYEFMLKTFSKGLKRNDNILLINGYEDRIKVKDYFNKNGLDYNEFCQEHDHDEEQEFYKNNIFKYDIAKNAYESGKSIVDFDFFDDNLPERYYYASMPYNYELYSIWVNFSGNLFDKIVVNGEAEIIKYEYPFKGFSDNGSALLMRDVFFEIDKYMTDDYYRNEEIVILGKLQLSYNILDGNFINN